MQPHGYPSSTISCVYRGKYWTVHKDAPLSPPLAAPPSALINSSPSTGELSTNPSRPGWRARSQRVCSCLSDFLHEALGSY